MKLTIGSEADRKPIPLGEQWKRNRIGNGMESKRIALSVWIAKSEKTGAL